MADPGQCFTVFVAALEPLKAIPAGIQADTIKVHE
jgi:hypothetical protein